eukprot:c24222_g1_i1.p1 GENE.c24222_g1_i1~~c24222_g1_i1.p1  ORF type:complete len:112 (+),score=29.00 c24222_g1_i1:30-338(+)
MVVQPTGLARGRNKGHKVTRRELPAKPVDRKGHGGKRAKFVRSVVREVMGFTPYEKRCLELLKVGKEKRVLRVLRKRLGSIDRAKRKRDDLQETLRVSRLQK